MCVSRVRFRPNDRGRCNLCGNYRLLMLGVCRNCMQEKHLIYCDDCGGGKICLYPLPKNGRCVCLRKEQKARYARADQSIAAVRTAVMEIPELEELMEEFPDVARKFREEL